MSRVSVIVVTMVTVVTMVAAVASGLAQEPTEPDWSQVEDETLRHFQALLRFDTSDPPGRELPAAEYVQEVLEQAGISVKVFALEAERPNVVARLRGDGTRDPLLLMAHTDVVNVDPEKWTFPPFSATRDGGYVYGRGTVDDKDNVAASLMVMLMLKRLKRKRRRKKKSLKGSASSRCSACPSRRCCARRTRS